MSTECSTISPQNRREPLSGNSDTYKAAAAMQPFMLGEQQHDYAIEDKHDQRIENKSIVIEYILFMCLFRKE